jgi:hypothetical protein
MKRLLVSAAVMVGLVGATSSANAATISAVGDTFTVSGSQVQGDGSISFTAVFTVLAYDASNITLGIDLSNDSVLGTTLTQAVITAFGFATDPNATGATGSTTGSNDTATDTDIFDNFDLGSIPSLSSVEVCTQADSIQNQCAGGNINNGLDSGENDLFLINLAGTWGAITTISDVGVKFQTNIGSFEFTGDGQGGDGQGGDGQGGDGQGGTPEPTTLLLLGSAFAVTAGRLRRVRARG